MLAYEGRGEGKEGGERGGGKGRGGGVGVREGCHRAGEATQTRVVQCARHTLSVLLHKTLGVV